MQSLDEKVDFMLQNQDDIRRCISNIQNNIMGVMTIQRDMLQTQFEIQRDIQRLDNKIDDNYQKLDKKIDDNYQKLDKKIDDNYQKLDKKIDDNYKKLDKKIDENAADTSEIFKDICVKLDELSNPKPRLTILK